jgi:hypothetical protein
LRFEPFAAMMLLVSKGANMGRELWSEVSAIIGQIDRKFLDNPRYTHATACIVRCHFWSVLNNAATYWACDRRNWAGVKAPDPLPDQSTLSRRLRSTLFRQFMQLLESRLAYLPDAGTIFKSLDGKPLPVAMHSKDRDATFGRGAGQKARGYKLHTVWAGGSMPLAWRVAPLHKDEREMAPRMFKQLSHLPGYVVADKNYDSNKLFDQAAMVNNHLICPRRYGNKKGLGHHRHSPHRLRSRELLEDPTRKLTRFGPRLMKNRGSIERKFGNAVSFTGGLNGLPPWVRRYGRVQRWVWAKLLINAARIRIKRRKAAAGA